ncbi:UDP-N-acetylmuramoyl-L-alanine--D-glutamate ligase [Capillimicrobium parvum]|uniref:UDP-N-acetylmuramoylalanine--D-glutamate ligase n=1 Tax=Capillimicrobium parvum TaxID=2884022 RepID=A0A9E7C0J1_9ACTN|nr:UDP-N-acetylmuramoyl-L-alanine--D-glutamate ligase [Capillimicrobium parvum]UGS35592.1 UDP-N-acetylmuramoyl-L-alanine--L-glutamate ligase [Capillimicrobium parvum]
MRVSELDGAAVGLWGAGREAAAAFRALSAGVVAVIATDEPVPDAERARFPGARFAHGADAVTALSRCDVVVRSPGISRYRDEVLELQAAGVQLTTATNLWFAEHHDEHVIGITGTKGKSTTASLVERLVTAAGAHAELAGNIGRPLLDLLHPQRPPDVWVVELSSYQAADLRFSPEVAVVVNLFREHVDWHGSEAVYYADKLNILRHRPRVAILNGRDARLVELAGEVPSVLFGVQAGYDVEEGAVVRDGRTVVRMDHTALLGEHNALNVAAALAAADAAGWPAADPEAALAGFEPLAHRLQTVIDDGAVRFVDDSISTTPESSAAALRALPGRPLALIVGGHDRGQDFAALADAVAEHGRVRRVVGVPDNGERALAAITARCGDAVEARMAHGLDEAVGLAHGAVYRGGVVLLSPAAPSFGHFRDFTERGERFRQAASRVRMPR